MNDLEYVIVTTGNDKRGVFAGYLKADKSPEFVILEQAKMIVSWPSEVRGIVGLANIGAINGCRLSYPAPEAKIFGVTAIFVCSNEAKKQFDRADIWS